MRNVYVVAHTEATHHVEQIVGGWYDSALTAKGVSDAGRVAAALGALIPGGRRVSLTSSDLLRTRQTAAPIAERLGVEVLTDPDLREQSYGAAEGTPVGSTPYVPPPAVRDRLHHRDGNEGSETRYEWAARSYAALHRVLARGPEDAVVVTHGGTATYLIAAWIGLPLEAAGYVKFAVSPGGITHLREDDFFHDRQVAALNMVDHLAPVAQPLVHGLPG